jgi:hypothetical protein
MIILSGVRQSPLGTTATTGLLYQPQMIDDGDCGAIGGMKIGRGNRSTRRKPAPVPLCPPQIPHDQTRARTRSAAVGSQRLTFWAMEWRYGYLISLKLLGFSDSSLVKNVWRQLLSPLTIVKERKLPVSSNKLTELYLSISQNRMNWSHSNYVV